MAELFEVAELVKVAVEDERTGVAFYSAMAKKVKDEQMRKTFAELAEQEKFHQRRFEQMLADLGGVRQGEEYPGEYLAYLQALTGDRAFPDEQTALQMVKECKDDHAALALASRFERDTLMLMNEMRRLVPERDKPVVDELASEEQAHLVALAEARAKLK